MAIPKMQQAIIHYYFFGKSLGLKEFESYVKIRKVEDYNTLEDMSTTLLEGLRKTLDEDLKKHNDEVKIDKLTVSILEWISKHASEFGLSSKPGDTDASQKKYLDDKKLFIHSLKIMPGVIKEILDKREAKPNIIDLEDLQEMKRKLETCKIPEDVKKVFVSYSGRSSTLFNNILRGNYTFNKPQLEKEAKENYIEPSIFIEIIRDISALRKNMQEKEVNVIKKDTDLYRGLKSPGLMKLLNFDKSKFKNPEDLVAKLKQSKPTFKEPAFASTSTDLGIAEDFARRSTEGFPVIFKIKAKEGTAYGRDMSDISIFEEEKEILLRPGQKFKVLDAELTFDARGRKEVTISLETVKSETVKQ